MADQELSARVSNLENKIDQLLNILTPKVQPTLSQIPKVELQQPKSAIPSSNKLSAVPVLSAKAPIVDKQMDLLLDELVAEEAEDDDEISFYDEEYASDEEYVQTATPKKQ